MGKHQVLQVTKSNFPRALEQIRAHIDQSHYVSISTRRTGGFRRPWHRVLPIDAPHVAYLKAKAASESHEIFQFAVCPFRLDGTDVVAFPYNFHLFPRDEMNIGMPSHSFSCQTSFMASMAREGFDFNGCIYDGISYLSKAQESKAKLQNSVPNICPTQIGSSFSTADEIFRNRTISKVRLWKDACRGPSEAGEDALFTCLRKLFLNGDLYGSRPSFPINVCNTHQMKLIVRALSETFDDIVPIVITSKDGGAKAVRAVLTSSEEDKKILLNELQNQEEELNRKFRGFREVLDLISNSRKPVVAYDCLNEFAFIHSKFLAPLPPSVTEFISSLRMVFSHTLDVSHLLKNLGPLRKAKNFPAAVQCLRRQFFVPFNMITPQDVEPRKSLGHNVVSIASTFAKLCRILEIDPGNGTGPCITSLGKHSNSFLPCSIGFQELEENARFLLDDARKVGTDHLVFVWGFGKWRSTPALKNLLRQTHDSFLEKFEVKLIDKNCAVIFFANPDLADTFLEDMKGGNACPIALMDLISNGLNAACYSAYKRICMAGIIDADLSDLFEKYCIENKQKPENDLKKEIWDLSWPDDLIASLNEM